MISPYSQDIELLRGTDATKDQSYFLSQISGSVLSRVLFPVGGLSKRRVREIAEELSFPNSKKKESMGICYIGERNMKRRTSATLHSRLP